MSKSFLERRAASRAALAAAILGAGGGWDAFRRLFRFYRQRDALDLRGVVDFSVPGSQVTLGSSCPRKCLMILSPHPLPFSLWSGFIFIPNPFLPGCQRHWVKQCLKLYPQKPNVCNLDLHMAPEKTIDLWGQSTEQLRRKGSSKREPKSLLEKLRWVTLGYHYNWDTKKYSANHHTPFPSDLAFLSEQVAAACGFRGFQAQAGILNYYHFDSSLGIHVDESELDHSRPLLSFSFGQSSIFLLGGLKREEAPTAMFMHSGDIMVMSGFSRLLYHAVPRVLPNPEGTALPSCLDQALPSDLPVGSVIERSSDEDWQVCAKYLQSSRINMTIRQVLAEGQKFPEESGTNGKGQAASEDSHHQENSRAKRHKPNPDS
uniref:Nucleic acid dioxygenase ALKBH1 n=1 Tax=Athene cunicularia TaxID=194338 RepID=A0A663MA39_ATHCN